MSLVFWGKVYLDLKKKRIEWNEKWLDLALDITLAILFSIAFVDLFFSLSPAIKLMEVVRGLNG